MTLKASIQQGRPDYEALRKVYRTCLGGSFMFPEGFAGCVHDFTQLDSGFCVCANCGHMHICCRGKCPDVISGNGERACLITGCITAEYEMRPERNALERVGTTPKSKLAAVGSTNLWESIQSVVQELLMSDKTLLCAKQERERSEGKEQSCFCRVVRDLAQNKKTNGVRPNMLHIMAMVCYGCRKHRPHISGQSTHAIREKCTESITYLIMQHGWVRVWRQLQNQTRGREFICSMLYLMRVGITFQKRQILPKMEILNSLLPMQALLPTVFKIRAKSITEGENIIKLDIRRVAL
jgi:hypothetical protein